MLKNEVMIFLTEKNLDLVHHPCNDSWLLKLCYLSDLHEKLSELNLFLQGENTNVFTPKFKIDTFIKKLLNIWKQKVENDYLKCSHLQKSFWLKMMWNQTLSNLI